jgi:hypothetical protein
MNIREVEKNGNKYQFVNEFAGTRSGFKHTTTVFKNGVEMAIATCHYLNRTWECYEYQTSMMKAVSELKEERQAVLVENWKRENGKSRIMQKTKDEIFAKDEILKELAEVRNELETR